jgi:hypothetical protein
MLYVPVKGSWAGFVVAVVPQSITAVKWYVSPMFALVNVSESKPKASPYGLSLNTDDVTVKLDTPLLSDPVICTAAYNVTFLL